MRPWAPRLIHTCSAAFIATSTATEPESLKKTWSSSPGASAASRRASRSAGAWVSPPNMMWGMASSWAETA